MLTIKYYFRYLAARYSIVSPSDTMLLGYKDSSISTTRKFKSKDDLILCAKLDITINGFIKAIKTVVLKPFY